jgi:hypothetical protein
MSMLDEMGVATRIDKDGVKFRAMVRTAWSNPPALAEQIIKIPGKDIITGKATVPAQTLATTNPGTPFAQDFDAGQGGLMVPAAMIGLASAVVLPAVMRALAGGGDGGPEPSESPTGGPAMDKADLVQLLLRAYAEEAYPKWQADHPKQKCPATLAEVAKYFGEDPGLPVLQDPWGHDLVMTCNDKDGFKVSSVGPDGTPGTDDDVHL